MRILALTDPNRDQQVRVVPFGLTIELLKCRCCQYVGIDAAVADDLFVNHLIEDTLADVQVGRINACTSSLEGRAQVCGPNRST